MGAIRRGEQAAVVHALDLLVRQRQLFGETWGREAYQQRGVPRFVDADGTQRTPFLFALDRQRWGIALTLFERRRDVEEGLLPEAAEGSTPEAEALWALLGHLKDVRDTRPLTPAMQRRMTAMVEAVIEQQSAPWVFFKLLDRAPSWFDAPLRLVRSGRVNPNAPVMLGEDGECENGLMRAVRRGHEGWVRGLLALGADPAWKNERYETAAHQAADFAVRCPLDRGGAMDLNIVEGRLACLEAMLHHTPALAGLRDMGWRLIADRRALSQERLRQARGPYGPGVGAADVALYQQRKLALLWQEAKPRRGLRL